MKGLIFKALLLAIVVIGGFAFSGDSAFAAGVDIYKQNCLLCHGEKGDGQGPMAQGLTPKPADFTDKEHMAKDTDEELIEAIKMGKGPMPPFGGTLSDQEIKDVLQYIRQFAK